MLLFDFHDFDSDAFFFDESDRQVFVAYGRAEDHLLAFQLFLQRRNGVGMFRFQNIYVSHLRLPSPVRKDSQNNDYPQGDIKIGEYSMHIIILTV